MGNSFAQQSSFLLHMWGELYILTNLFTSYSPSLFGINVCYGASSGRMKTVFLSLCFEFSIWNYCPCSRRVKSNVISRWIYFITYECKVNWLSRRRMDENVVVVALLDLFENQTLLRNYSVRRRVETGRGRILFLIWTKLENINRRKKLVVKKPKQLITGGYALLINKQEAHLGSVRKKPTLTVSPSSDWMSKGSGFKNSVRK